jgi:hypothetical protein
MLYRASMPVAVERLLDAAVVAVAAMLIAVRFNASDLSSHSASDTLRPWFVQTTLIVVAAAAIIFVVGRVASARR